MGRGAGEGQVFWARNFHKLRRGGIKFAFLHVSIRQIKSRTCMQSCSSLTKVAVWTLWCHLLAGPLRLFLGSKFSWLARPFWCSRKEGKRSLLLLVPFLYCTLCFVCLILKLPLCGSVASINNWEGNSVGKALSLPLCGGSSLRLWAAACQRSNYTASVCHGY